MHTTSLRDKRKLETRLDIIQAGMALFMERGFDAVSVEMICERAGISRATFFNYFPQKELILSEMVLSRIEKMREFLHDYVNHKRAGSLPDIVSLLLDYADQNEKLGDKGRHLFLQMLARPACHASHREMRSQMISAMTGLIERMKKDGRLNGVRHSASIIAETLFSLYLATSVEWLLQDSVPEGWLVKTLKTRIEVAMEGILP